MRPKRRSKSRSSLTLHPEVWHFSPPDILRSGRHHVESQRDRALSVLCAGWSRCCAPVCKSNEVYNDLDGQKHEIFMPKKSVAIVENPMADVMTPNSTISKTSAAVHPGFDR